MALAKTPFWCAFLSSKNTSGPSSCGTEHLCEQGQEGRSRSHGHKLWHEKFQLDRRKIFFRVGPAKHWSRCPDEMWNLLQLKYLILILGRLWTIQSDWLCHQHRLGQGSLQSSLSTSINICFYESKLEKNLKKKKRQKYSNFFCTCEMSYLGICHCPGAKNEFFLNV